MVNFTLVKLNVVFFYFQTKKISQLSEITSVAVEEVAQYFICQKFPPKLQTTVLT